MTYIKLRNLEIGYTLPKAWTAKIGIPKFRVYLAGQNLLSIDNINFDIDPEITATNGMAYPNMKVINVGFSMDF